MICLLYGLLFGYNTTSVFEEQDTPLFISILTILAIAGFGLLNAYITNASFSGMALSLLVFALTIQHYFLMRAFWSKAGAYFTDGEKTFVTNNRSDTLSFTNYKQDRDLGMIESYTYSSIADAIACAISMLVAFSALVGRIQPFEVFFLTVFGSFFYEVNSQLLWNFKITDIGYGMRIFIFGSLMGLISSIILGRRNTTSDHYYYRSVYATRSMGLVGLVIVFAAFPMLSVAGVYNVSVRYNLIKYIVPLNMWLALGAGILGSFSMSAIINGKIYLHDLLYSGLSGGIVYSSSADLHKNPAVPLTVGFLMGAVICAYNSRALRSLNKYGVKSSLSIIHMYLLPGLFSGFLSGILHAIGGDSSY